MLNLAFDTATLHGRFALADASGVLVYRPLNVGGSYADALLTVIGEMLETTGHARDQITGLGVTTGPGSFTGVRIGVATAKGLAYALGCELFAVGTLEAMAAALLAETPDSPLAVPVLDARRGEIFAGAYVRRGRWVAPLLEPAALPPDTWWARLKEGLEDVEAPAYGGDGAGLLLGQGDSLRPELARRGAPVLRAWSAAHPATAPALALALGDPDSGLQPAHPFAVVPTYMRVSDAEVKRRVDLTPRQPGTDVTAHRSRRSEP